jgi:isopentenyl-diphosphate delta-isomerase
MVETLSVVDENDNLLRGEERKIVHSSKQWHRGIEIFLFNSKGELLVQRRSPDKDKHPNKYCCSVSGHVDYGKDYKETALREMEEELGIKNVEIKPLLYFRYISGPQDYHIEKLFTCTYDGEIKPNEEVSEIKFFIIEDLMKIIKEKPDMFTPWLIDLLKWYLKMDNKLHILKVY